MGNVILILRRHIPQVLLYFLDFRLESSILFIQTIDSIIQLLDCFLY